MYVRAFMIRGVRNLHLVYTYRRKSKTKYVTVAILGRYDKDRLQEFRELVSDWQPLQRAPVVIEEISALGSPVPGKMHYFARCRQWHRRRKGI